MQKAKSHTHYVNSKPTQKNLDPIFCGQVAIITFQMNTFNKSSIAATIILWHDFSLQLKLTHLCGFGMNHLRSHLVSFKTFTVIRQFDLLAANMSLE